MFTWQVHLYPQDIKVQDEVVKKIKSRKHLPLSDLWHWAYFGIRHWSRYKGPTEAQTLRFWPLRLGNPKLWDKTEILKRSNVSIKKKNYWSAENFLVQLNLKNLTKQFFFSERVFRRFEYFPASSINSTAMISFNNFVDNLTVTRRGEKVVVLLDIYSFFSLIKLPKEFL